MTFGYQQGNEFDAALYRIDNSKQVVNYEGEYFGPGDHLVMVTKLETEGTGPNNADGPKAKVYFEVVNTNAQPYKAMKNSGPNTPFVETEMKPHKIGDVLVRIYKLTKPAPKPSMLSDSDQFAELVRKLSGAPAGTNVTQFSRALLIERRDEQLLRGMLVMAHGRLNKKGTYVNVAWDTVPQTQQEIAARRAALDAKVVAGPAAPQAPAAPQPQFQQQPMQPQPGYGPMPEQQIQGAPNPMYYPNAPQAPQQPWQAQPQAQPQYAPPAAAPQPTPTQQPGALLSQIPGFNK